MNETIAALLVGMVFGASIGFYIAFERYMRRERPTITITVDDAFVAKLDRAVVERWAIQRGLVWMPKGPEFRPKVKS